VEERDGGIDEVIDKGMRAHAFDSAVKSFEPPNRLQTELGSGARTKVNAARSTKSTETKEELQLSALGPPISERVFWLVRTDNEW
jgi:hypothetical protein